MVVTDPVADMLTRIRNGIIAKYDTVDVPVSNLKGEVARILKEEGYINDVEKIEDGIHSVFRISLKYGEKKESIIKGLKKISKPGLRVYANVDELPKVLNGLGIAIISTSKGVMTDKQARALRVGGEVLAYIW